MAIRDWSGRRLVGTWIAGAAAEVALIAMPLVFLVFVSAARPGAGAAITAADAAEARAHFSGRTTTYRALDREIVSSSARVEQIDGDALWGLAGFAAVALYVLAIPVGLLVITGIWMISRFGDN